MFYSKTSPVKDLGMRLILWLDIYRDDGEDDPVEFRAGAFSLFCESVRSIGIVETNRKKRLKALTSLQERKTNLLLDRKLNFGWPIMNTFACSEGTNVKSRGFLEGNAAFGVTLGKLKSPLGDDR